MARVAYMDTARLPEGTEAGLENTSRYTAPPGFRFSNATHVCKCEVDAETGQVELLDYVVSEDCGIMINPMVVDGQVSGGVVQGIGQVLLEHMAYDSTGTPARLYPQGVLDTYLRSHTDYPNRPYRNAVRDTWRAKGHGRRRDSRSSRRRGLFYCRRSCAARGPGSRSQPCARHRYCSSSATLKLKRQPRAEYNRDKADCGDGQG